MGDVSLTFRVLPAEPSTDLDKLASDVKGSLPPNATLKGTSVKPFAFGLSALMCNVVVPDESGLADQVEEAIRGIPAVQGCELVDMGRLI